MLFKPIGDTAIKVEAGVAAVDAVIAVRIDELHEGLFGLYESLGEFGSIA